MDACGCLVHYSSLEGHMPISLDLSLASSTCCDSTITFWKNQTFVRVWLLARQSKMIQTVKFVIGNLHTYNLYKYIISGPGHVLAWFPPSWGEKVVAFGEFGLEARPEKMVSLDGFPPIKWCNKAGNLVGTDVGFRVKLVVVFGWKVQIELGRRFHVSCSTWGLLPSVFWSQWGEPWKATWGLCETVSRQWCGWLQGHLWMILDDFVC